MERSFAVLVLPCQVFPKQIYLMGSEGLLSHSVWVGQNPQGRVAASIAAIPAWEKLQVVEQSEVRHLSTSAAPPA